ncbi:MAG TPA: LytTR family DNA-binding domain-containing protein [Patescibacteria group bacterium]|nr:LytTR family DNA-binding domain-containing protein [Patescibacteria group bacterium]
MIGAAYTIRVLIIDDEEPARNELRYLLSQPPDVVVVGESDHCRDLLNVVQTLRPHLVFMDIDMPETNGIQAAELLQQALLPPLVVFATAHEEYALKAFDLNVVDYLLKPFSARRIERCLEKVRSMLERAIIPEQRLSELLSDRTMTKKKLVLEDNGKMTVIPFQDIIAANCTDGQLAIHTSGKTYQSSMTLQELLSRLDESLFFRSHRAYLVNIEKIREIVPWFNGTYNLLLENFHEEIPVSRQQAVKLKKIFHF